MTKTTRPILVLAALLISLAAFAADWPQLLGPTANSIAPDTGINKNWNANPPRELWRIDMHDDGYAGPSVADGKVFIIDHDGAEDVVRAISLADGSDVWQFRYPDLSKASYGFSRCTPSYAGGMLYTVSFLGKVHCINAETGQMVWMRDMRAEFGGGVPKWGYSMSALVDGDKVIVCPGGSGTAVVALNATTGATIWQGGGSDGAGYSTPVKGTILGTDQYVVFTGKSVIGVDAASGTGLWRHPWETKYDVNAAAPIIAGDAVFITSGYGHGCAVVQIDAGGASVVWENREVMAHFNSPIYYKSLFFANSDPGLLVCLNPSTGQAIWKQQGFEKGGLVIVDDTIIAINGGGGDVIMVNATGDGYQELGRINPLGGQSWTAPIIADGKLIVRNKEAMICLDLM